MTKTIAIIGASYLQRPLVERAKQLGLRTICFAWAEGAVCKDICDVFYPISITEKEQILDVCRKEQIDGVCTIASDVAAPTVAYVAEQMKLTGNSYEAAVRANNKFAMRNAFMAGGVPCPAYHVCKSFDELAQTDIHYPVIVKPTDRSGSLGITKVTNPDELRQAVTIAVNHSFEHEALVEQFIEGREISVEFISYGGTHYPLQITDKVTTEAPHFVELAHHQPAELTEEQYKAIYALTQKALNALGVTNGASHSEYKITADGQIYVMEIGARMGGDFIGSDLVRLSTGYDFVQGVIEVALGLFEVPQQPVHKYAGVYFLSAETEQVKHYIDHQDDYPEIVMAEQTSDELRHVNCSSERSGYFIYQADHKFKIETV